MKVVWAEGGKDGSRLLSGERQKAGSAETLTEGRGLEQLTRRNITHRGLQPQGHFFLFLETWTLPRDCPAGTTQVILFQNRAPSLSVQHIS